jgi:8-oxo-dGTP diphosphatase
MTIVKFHPLDSITSSRLKFAVICAEFDNQWIYVRHKDRSSWELPGGHREPDEDIYATAKRELFEEAGATDYALFSIAEYSVALNKKSAPSFGRLFYAQIKFLDTKPDSEIKEVDVYQIPPAIQTYPHIQPKLFQKILAWKKETRTG